MKEKDTCIDKIKSSLASKYLSFAILLILVFGAFQYHAINSLKQSQNVTIEKFSEHIKKVDTCVTNLKQYALDNMIGVQNASSNIVLDSLINASVGKGKPLTESQHKVLVETINIHFSHLTKVKDDYEAKFLKDSLLLSVERTLLEGQTKSMIELHLEKIEHEYSNITMWAAILTLVFLVFSFYSMFKLEEYIKQGKDDVQHIKEIKEESITHLTKIKLQSDEIKDDITTKYNEALDKTLSNFKTKSDNVIDEYNEKLQVQVSTLQSTAELEIGNYRQSLDERFELLSKSIDNKYSDIERNIKRLETSINTYQEAISQLKSSTPEISDNK